jgi:putative DNA primase/helicase
MSRPDESDRATRALFAIDPGCDRNTWVAVAMSYKAAVGEAGEDEFVRWSSAASNYRSERDCRDVWRSCTIDADGGIGEGTLFHLARKAGWRDGNGEFPPRTAARTRPKRAEPAPRRPAPGATPEALWAASRPATAAHAYIERKLGLPTGLRVYRGPHTIARDPIDGSLVVPARDAEGVLQTLQFIPAEAGQRKLTLADTHFGAGFHAVGPALGRATRAYLVEGLGQAWSAHQASGEPAIVTFGKSRFAAIARAVRAKWPDLDLIIVPDRGGEAIAAKLAAELACGWVALPEDRPMNYDLNDEHVNAGLKAVNKILEGVKRAPEAKAARVVIEIQAGDGGTTVHQAVMALVKAGGFYNRAGLLVRVIETREVRALGLRLRSQGVERDTAQPVIVQVSVDYLVQRLDEIVSFQKYDARAKSLRPVNCPRELALRILALGEWEGIPVLRAITMAPFLRSDGTVCTTEGYDPASATLLFKNGVTLPMEESPDELAAAAALDALRAPFSEIPWADPMHESAFLACMLTVLLRPILPTVPAFIFTAPTAGSGKTLLLDCGSIIVHGIKPAKRSYPKDEDELRKVLQAVLLAGDPVLAFDNVRAGTAIGADSLNLYVTADVVGDRTLGYSEVRRIANCTVIALTGNNVGARADFVRRAIAIKIDPNVEQPEERRFTIPDLTGHIQRERPELLRALLTLVRAFVVAGAPAPTRAPLGAFEAWDALVCGTLIWAGMPDPLATQRDIRGEDPDALSAANLFAELERVSGGGFFKATQIRKLIEGGTEPTLAEAVHEACNELKTLGYWLRAHNGQVHGTLKLIRPTGITTGHATWRIKRTRDQ